MYLYPPLNRVIFLLLGGRKLRGRVVFDNFSKKKVVSSCAFLTSLPSSGWRVVEQPRFEFRGQRPQHQVRHQPQPHAGPGGQGRRGGGGRGGCQRQHDGRRRGGVGGTENPQNY